MRTFLVEDVDAYESEQIEATTAEEAVRKYAMQLAGYGIWEDDRDYKAPLRVFELAFEGTAHITPDGEFVLEDRRD